MSIITDNDRHDTISRLPVERYLPYMEPHDGSTNSTEWAQEILEQGLLAAINVLVLHPLGYALGTTVIVGEAVADVIIAKTSDPEGIEFTPSALAKGVVKLEAAGHTALADKVLKAYESRGR